jgi:hydrogenase maturation protease
VAERRLVVGVGNPLRGDDAAGVLVAAALDAADGVDVMVSDGDPGELIERWAGTDVVVIVDAMRGGRPVGEVLAVDVSDDPLPAGIRLGSSHHLGVAEAVELARALDRLPRRVVVVGIEGRAFGVGDPLSPRVEAAVPIAAALARDEVHRA